MADVQDEDQWLYGDEKDENREEETNDQPEKPEEENAQNEEPHPEEQVEDTDKDEVEPEPEGETETEAEAEVVESEKEANDQNGDKASSSDDDDDDDDLTVTIGEVKKQADIIQPTHPARFQPKAAPTSGLKDDDFTNVGKVNGTPLTEFDMSEFEEKPWRKPGADLSDYFNYGFIEDTWLKYCEKQKQMRINESNVGLGSLGVNVKQIGKLSSLANITIVNENSKYVGQRKLGQPMRRIDMLKPEGNSIQVMTADRRSYSSKAISYANDSLEYGGDPYNTTPYYSTDTPPPNFFSNPPPPQYQNDNWSGPVPDNSGGWTGDSSIPPPNYVPISVTPQNTAYDEESSRGHDDDRHRPRRSHHGGRRSRSPSRHRRRSRSRSRSKSRSRSPHRHKRKKSKRDRDGE